MNWAKLLSTKRLNRISTPTDSGRSPFQQDRDLIVFSNAFRRLADKTQVHPFTENDHVRTRLTHSIEVASVGRSLGKIVGNTIAQKMDGAIGSDDIGYIVEAACLAHDIGNPPFGHSGEDAIASWFRCEGEKFIEMLDEQQATDLKNYEGNAQGFRILTQLENYRWKGGLQLTHSVLGAFTKYPTPSNAVATDKRSYVGRKKNSYFAAEQLHFESAFTELGIPIDHAGLAWRHPLAFLMEAADDICYRIIDIEDAYELGRLSFTEAENCLKEMAAPSQRYNERDETEKVGYLRALAIGKLIDELSNIFLINESAILNGEFGSAGESLIDKSQFSIKLAANKKLMHDRVFTSELVLRAEIAGYEVIHGLLAKMTKLLEELEKVGYDRTKLSLQHQKLANFLGINLKNLNDRYNGLLRITDYISGMTDHFAVNLYRKLKGISI